jgi:hypothetical protein
MTIVWQPFYRQRGFAAMSTKSEEGKVPLTIHLPVDIAHRLQLESETRKRPPADLILELLSRHLPNPGPKGPGKGKIPYT